VLPLAVDAENRRPRWQGWNAAAAIPNMVVGLAAAGPVWTSRLVLSKLTLTATTSVAPRQS
jgi:hypothetical protein